MSANVSLAEHSEGRQGIGAEGEEVEVPGSCKTAVTKLRAEGTFVHDLVPVFESQACSLRLLSNS